MRLQFNMKKYDSKGASGSFAGCLFLVSFILNNKDESLL